MGFLMYLTITLFIIVAVFLVLLILIQKGRGGGLASAFGGAGGNTAFGSKTGDVLTWATSIVFGIFLLLAVVLNLLARNVNDDVVAATGTNEAPTEQRTPGSSQVPQPVGDPILPNRDLPESPGGVAPSGPTNLAAPAPTTQPK